MNKQNQIKRTLSHPQTTEHIRSRLDNLGNTGRTRFAEELCQHFNFFDPAGKPQTAGCLKALRELEKQGWFILPTSQTRKAGQPVGIKRLDEPVAPPAPLPQDVSDIEQLKLIQVSTEWHRRIWNELMIRDHPQGDKPLVGRQVRYLIQSEHGWLGGVGFSAAALNLEARDRWIGWDWGTRQEHLHSVVNMSRFLIREGIHCHNLASKILGMAVRTLPGDFQKRYGYRPLLLESFVDVEHHQGTSYKAANWQWVGKTKGRGRQDTQMQAPESIKDIYMYPLVRDFRRQLPLENNAGLGKLTIAESLDGDSGIEKEFAGAPLGDKRLSKRLVDIGRERSERPGSSYINSTQGDWSKVKAYYRFIDQPDDSALSMTNILLPHREQTVRRMKAEDTVLCVQDGSDLNYSRVTECSGLGQIGTNQTGAISAGLHLHSTLALTTEGLPLGVLSAQCTAPKPGSRPKRKPSDIPIEEKKTFSWIEGLRDSAALKAQMPHTAIVNVLDREADFFELFHQQRTQCACVNLLVRAKHDRTTTGKDSLFERVKKSRVKETLTLSVPRKSARAKKSKQKASLEQAGRKASVSLRYQPVELTPPTTHKNAQALTLWVVHVREYNVPKNAVPLEWFLLTTIAIETTEDALKCVKWYKLRWRIEDWHRVLKSGCGVEKLQHKTAERLKRAVAINMVVAWRIMLMTLLGREAPALPADVMFSDIEIKVLTAYAQKKNYSLPKTLKDAVKLVAKLGGYLARANDPEPGHQIMWRGYEFLQGMCEGFLLLSG